MITVPMVLVCFMVFVSVTTRLHWKSFYSPRREKNYDYECEAIAVNVVGWIIVVIALVRVYDYCPKHGC